MGVELQAGSAVQPSVAIEAAGGRPVFGRTEWLALGGYLGVAVLVLAAPVSAQVRERVGEGARVLGAVGAVVACVVAAGRGVRGGRAPWLLFAAAAGVVGVAEARFLFVLFHPLFITGAILELRPLRVRGLALELGLDAALILVVSGLFVLRFILAPLADADAAGPLEAGLLLVAELAPVGSLFFAGVLLLSRDARLPSRSAGYLFWMAAAFVVGNVAVELERGGPGPWLDVVWLSGWLLLILAALDAARRPDAITGAVPSRLARRIRLGVVPAATLALGGFAVDAAFEPPVAPGVPAGFAVLGVLLAVRVASALRISERNVEERQQLEYNRALVEVSRALAGTTELQRTLELVTEWVCRLLDARGAGIELLTPDGQTLVIRAACGLPDSALGMRYPVQGSFTGWVVLHCLPRSTPAASDDPFIQPQSLEFLGSEPAAAAPLRFRDRTLGALFVCYRERPFTARELELLGALADQAATAIETARLFEEVKALSLTDPLTGLANRRQIEIVLAREFAAAERGRRLFAVLFDLDDFKRYNDRWGHLAGDEALRLIGGILRSETRAMNLAGRFGGDEFLALLTDADWPGVRGFVDRIIERFDQEMAGLGRTLTLSAGMAAYTRGMRTPLELLAAADRALYREKERC